MTYALKREPSWSVYKQQSMHACEFGILGLTSYHIIFDLHSRSSKGNNVLQKSTTVSNTAWLLEIINLIL